MRGRVVAIGGVIVLLLIAGVWITLNHASAQSSDGSAKTKPAASASPSSSAPVGPLQLVSETPASGARGVNGVATIKIQFGAPLAPDSPLPKISPNIAGSWQGAGTSTLEFVPTTAFQQYTHVTVTIPGGPTGVRSVHGNLLGAS